MGIIYVFMIIVLLFTVFLLSIAFTKPKKKKASPEEIIEFYQFYQIKQIYDNLNQYINRYNELTGLFDAKFQNKRKEAVICHDQCSLAELNSISEQYINYKLSVENQILESKQNFHNQEYEISKPHIINAGLSSINNLLKELDLITPEEPVFEEPVQTQTASSVTYFSGCNTKEEADKRYKALAKAFHPDMGYGDESSFNAMQKEYDNLSF